MAKFYCLDVERDLFDTIVAQRRWGRIGTVGRTMSMPFMSMDAALQEVGRLELAKRRRGYVNRPE
jgi:predicted DNA-binding WGR domain protein